MPERDLYWIWNSRTNRWALRRGEWKIVHYGFPAPTNPSDWQLFNLVNDPREQRDVAGAHPQTVERLHRRFLEQRARDKG